MKLIAGLGNPGDKYDLTRHNVGWHAIDALARFLDCRVYVNRSSGLTGTAYYEGEKLLLVKPLTYMNLSGECLAPLAAYYKLAPEDVLVICDDVNLPLGQLRLRKGGSAGGHNGLKSIIERLGSDQFPRIRIGVGPQPAGMDLVEFVLRTLSAGEQKEAAAAEERAAKAALLAVKNGLGAAMNEYNQRIRPDGEKL